MCVLGKWRYSEYLSILLVPHRIFMKWLEDTVDKLTDNNEADTYDRVVCIGERDTGTLCARVYL